MKTTFILRCVLMLLPISLWAQYSGSALPANREIGISEQQTTSLLFPYRILSVDRGSRDILAQKPKGLENILQIKAVQEEFLSSNLTVVTAEGKLYNFLVYYEACPYYSAYDFTGKGTGEVVAEHTDNAALLDALASKAYHDRHRIRLNESDNGITLSVTGMFVEEEYFFYRITIENATNISYTIDKLRFLIRDQKRSRRTASQDIEITPITVWEPTEKVPPNALKTFVVVLPKFTIPDKKNLFVALTEASGGRHLQLKLRNRKATQVVPLPTFNE
ncbi:conjugative transposon protein TraN [Flavobacterium suzhouense]|uniref:Conjugative transposon protein TraN n=1 Tax=Flavobacterium suzhouense TaxID=1529638 RepID=A0ABW5NVD3_9FLAO